MFLANILEQCNVPDPKGLASLVKSLRKSLMQIEKRKQV